MYIALFYEYPDVRRFLRKPIKKAAMQKLKIKI